jgi:uracil-DNA glycosylase family 4
METTMTELLLKQTDLDQVTRKHPLAKCEECPLYEVGKYVPSVGPAKAKVAFVGEAPGVNEVTKQEPFSGQSGKLLNKVMGHHGIVREEVFLSNACLCRPPDNSTPPKLAINSCRDRLLSELTDHEVETVVALGNSAAESILGVSGVTKLRVGPGKFTDRLPGVRVIPTIHPAAALRQSDMFPHIVTDVGKVVLQHGVWTPPEYVVLDDVADALAAIDDLGRREDVTDLVIDIEVDIEKDTAHDHPNQYGMLCVGVCYARGRVAIFTGRVMESGEVRSRLAELLRHKRITAQNGKFDLAGLYPLLGGLELYFDTMLASYTFDERPGIHGLKYMAVEYLGTPQYDDEIKKYVGPGIGYGAIPKDLLYKYNAYDCACTWELKEMFEKKFEGHPDLRRVHDFLVAASNQLMYVELNGISVDREYLSKLSTEYLQRLDSLEEQLDDIIGKSTFDIKLYDKARGEGINPRSPQQVKKYLADRGVVVPGTDVDMLTMVAERLQKMSQEEHEVFRFITTLLRHRREAKLYGTYVKGIRKRLYGGRVFPSFLLHGTTTGRPACRNPNLLNIPRESSIRRLFVPSKPDHVFMQTDYSQAELRVLSYLAGDQYFRDIFNAGGRDVFDELSGVLYPGVTKEQVGAARFKDMRVRVKAFVYGLSYGREPYSIALEFGISQKEAETMKANFFEVIPEIVEFQRDIKAKVMNGEDLITPWGRHRRFMLITPENKKNTMNEALAFMPQSTASDMCMSAFVKTRQELKGIGYVRNIIYDAMLVECHQEDVEEVRGIVETNMIEAAKSVVGDYIKFEVDTDVGPSWGDC